MKQSIAGFYIRNFQAQGRSSLQLDKGQPLSRMIKMRSILGVYSLIPFQTYQQIWATSWMLVMDLC